MTCVVTLLKKVCTTNKILFEWLALVKCFSWFCMTTKSFPSTLQCIFGCIYVMYNIFSGHQYVCHMFDPNSELSPSCQRLAWF